MTEQVLERLSKRGLPSALFIAVAFGIAAFVPYADDIPATSGILQVAPWLFDHNIVFSFVIIFVAYGAWVWGLGGGALVLAATLAALGAHIAFEVEAVERSRHAAHLVLAGVGAGVAMVAFARLGEEQWFV